MKERYIPTKDLKTGLRVTYDVAGGVFEELKPYLKVYLSKSVERFLVQFGRHESFKL